MNEPVTLLETTEWSEKYSQIVDKKQRIVLVDFNLDEWSNSFGKEVLFSELEPVNKYISVAVVILRKDS